MLFLMLRKREYLNDKWSTILNTDLDDQKWKEAYKICFKSVQDNYLTWLQYKILNRILGVKRFLHIINISTDSNCRLCNAGEESISHLFCNCFKVQPLWENLTIWIYNKLGYQINIDTQTIIFGHYHRGNSYIPLNTILLVTKSYIFWCARLKKDPDIFQVQKWVEKTYNEQYALACTNLRQDIFYKKWNQWSAIFT